MAHTDGGPGRPWTLPWLAPVAQLDRAGGFYPSGSGFDSWQGRGPLTSRERGRRGQRERAPAVPTGVGSVGPDVADSHPDSGWGSTANPETDRLS